MFESIFSVSYCTIGVYYCSTSQNTPIPKHHSKPMHNSTSLLRNQALVRLPKHARKISPKTFRGSCLHASRQKDQAWKKLRMSACWLALRPHPSQLCLSKVVQYVVHITVFWGRLQVCEKVSYLGNISPKPVGQSGYNNDAAQYNGIFSIKLPNLSYIVVGRAEPIFSPLYPDISYIDTLAVIGWCWVRHPYDLYTSVPTPSYWHSSSVWLRALSASSWQTDGSDLPNLEGISRWQGELYLFVFVVTKTTTIEVYLLYGYEGFKFCGGYQWNILKVFISRVATVAFRIDLILDWVVFYCMTSLLKIFRGKLLWRKYRKNLGVEILSALKFLEKITWGGFASTNNVSISLLVDTCP